jgi:organic radical activating enzyme
MNRETLINLKNEISQTLCLAKFHEATLWLYSGKIASCHHTPLVPVGDSIISFFNPTEKRQQQVLMLSGNKPTECSYCWKLEDKNLTSDRYKKSLGFKSSLSANEYMDPSYNFKPKALELSFQNLCNLACCYCSADYSSKWADDLTKNGNYTSITTDKRLHYQRGVDNHTPADMTLFWEWFDSVATEIESIRITGGEPLLHEETFKVFDIMQAINPNIEFVIHTNLCQKPTVIDRFIDKISKFTNVRLNISNESAGNVAEFIRDGMDYDQWLSNLKVLSNSNANLSISTTITALALTNLDQLYLDIIELRKDTKQKVYIAVNFATYPEFQSISCLTKDEMKFYYDKYKVLFDSINDNLLDIERSHVTRMLTMLQSDEDCNQHQLRNDSDSFFEQYSQRRNKTNLITTIGLK